MTKKYKTVEGDYLVLQEDPDGNYRILWFIAEWQGTGGCLGEVARGPEPPLTKDDWEGWQADRTVEPLADGKNIDGFYFETLKKGRLALKTANEALHTGDAPWPGWAHQAKEAGWTPPEGWKP